MTFKRAIVTAVGPLRILIDGDTVPIPFTPKSLIDPATLAVDDVVHADQSGHRLVVLGRAGGLILPTASTTVAGIATLPVGVGADRPAFQAGGSGTVSKSGTTSSSTLIFNVEHFDQTGDYSPTTGVFTAPIAGLYQVSFSTAQTTSVTGPELDVVVNGTPVYTQVAIGYSTFYHTFGTTVLLQLAATDTVEILWQNNSSTSVTLDRSRSYFSGHYLG